jgi:indolepyruvate ferredoxin oxidoreductase
MAGFKLMMKLRVLRGTPLDPFGFHPDRKLERSLIAEYVSVMDRCLPFLTAATLPIVIDVAGVPETIRGCGPVKRRHAEAARTEYAVLMDRLRHHVPLSASLSAAQ